MASFTFNFLPTEETEQGITAQDQMPAEVPSNRPPSVRHSIGDLRSTLPETLEAQWVEKEAVGVWRREVGDVKFQAAQEVDPVEGQETSQSSLVLGSGPSDLVSGVYEGGLKTWECSEDLLAYLGNDELFPSGSLKGQSVLELGCGSALPSLYLLRKHTDLEHVVLQDYNAHVLERITFPNCLLNTPSAPIQVSPSSQVLGELETMDLNESVYDHLARRISFVSGDWLDLTETLHQGSSPSQAPALFHLILTSETIYTTSTYPALYQAMTRHLHPNGRILLAAKSVYFGCSGDLRSFLDYVDRVRGAELVWERVYTSLDPQGHHQQGVEREIIQLRWASLPKME